MSQKMPFFIAKIQKMCAKNANMYRSYYERKLPFWLRLKNRHKWHQPIAFHFFRQSGRPLQNQFNNIDCMYFSHTNHHFPFEGGIKYVR